MMTRPIRVLLSVIAFAPLAAACGGGKPPTMEGREGMLSKTAIAQKCEEAAKGHDRPFVVQWDATDLASFEAFAARDTVVVKYEGCDIQVLDHCSDPGVGAKFGAYGMPQFTSGTVQGFDIANQGDLYAKLPLGAASFSGKVEAGESLHLKYFVSGVSTDSRDALYSGELAKYPGCAGATHFVWGYNLGAFELATAEHNAEHAQAGFGNVGAGGNSGHQESALANGGSMASCETNDQRSCRVPIRLVLRAITQGDPPAADPSQMQIVAGGAKGTLQQWQDPNFRANTPENQAAALVTEANKRVEQRDGASCLQLLDRATQLNPQVASQVGWTHARCEMMAGKCEDGKKEFRSVFVKRDPDRRLTDAQIDTQVNEQANNNCPSSTATTSAEYILRATHELEAARAAKDGPRCVALSNGIQDKMKTLDIKNRDDNVARARGVNSLDTAAYCIGESQGCAAGLEAYKTAYRAHFNGHVDDKIVNSSGVNMWNGIVKSGQVTCQ